MGPLAQFIARYGVVMGKAMWEASKKGIALFKKSKEIPKIKLKPKPKMSDADYKKKFAAQNKEAVYNMKEAARQSRVKKSVQKFKEDRDITADPRYVKPLDTSGQPTALMNAPVAATALAGTTASLVHENKSKKRK